MRSGRRTAGAGSNAKGSKREAVLKALRHEDVRPIPYYFDLTEEVNHKMQMHTRDPLFFEHSGSYLAQQRNESFTDIDGTFFRVTCSASYGISARRKAISAS